MLPVPPRLTALSAIVVVPDATGVPEMSPEPVSIVSPVGKLDAAKLVGLLAAVI